jgi:hypothetical protein
MQNCQAKSVLWAGVVVCAVVLGFTSLDSVSAKNNKVDICHYQEENDRWKLLSLPQPAAAAHLEHHDDAIPSGTTAQTQTVLDADCEPVEVICPCEGQMHEGVSWSTDFPRPLVCLGSLMEGVGFLVILRRFQVFDDHLQIVATDNGRRCGFGVEHPIVEMDLSLAEVAACEDSLRQIAANDGVTCPE